MIYHTHAVADGHIHAPALTPKIHIFFHHNFFPTKNKNCKKKDKTGRRRGFFSYQHFYNGSSAQARHTHFFISIFCCQFFFFFSLFIIVNFIFFQLSFNRTLYDLYFNFFFHIFYHYYFILFIDP